MSWLENKKKWTQSKAFVLMLSTELTPLYKKRGVPRLDGKEEIWGTWLHFCSCVTRNVFIMDGEDQREIFSEVGLLFSRHHQNSFYRWTEKKEKGAQGWTFVLVSPKHISMKRKKYRGTMLDFCSLVVRTASHQLSFVSRFLASLLGDDESTDDAATVEFPNTRVMALP